MTSARPVPRSIRRLSPPWALPFLAALALAACGGKVVVDADTGEGGAGGTTMTSASVQPSTGTTTPSTCQAAVDHLSTCVPVTSGPIQVPSPCDGQTLCQMACILATSCEGLLGTDFEASQKFADCVNGCV